MSGFLKIFWLENWRTGGTIISESLTSFYESTTINVKESVKPRSNIMEKKKTSINHMFSGVVKGFRA